jgi:hypothetical protein
LARLFGFGMTCSEAKIFLGVAAGAKGSARLGWQKAQLV